MGKKNIFLFALLLALVGAGAVAANIAVLRFFTRGSDRAVLESFKGRDYKDILTENEMDKYIPVFEENKLDDLAIIIELTENDYEKLGIDLMGDRKRLLKLFSKSEINNLAKKKPDNIDIPDNTEYIPRVTTLILSRNCVTESSLINIIIDGKIVVAMDNYSIEKVLVENGSHSICASWTTTSVLSFEKENYSKRVFFIAEGSDIIFNIISKNSSDIAIEMCEREKLNDYANLGN